MTILNFRGQLLNDPKIRPNAMGNLNKVVQALDNIEAIFPGNRHAMWSAIEFLQPMMEDFFKFLNNMLILGFKDESILLKMQPFGINSTTILDDFSMSGVSPLDELINNYFDFVKNVVFNESEWITNEDDEASIEKRSFELQVLLGKIPNPVALVNYYSQPGKYDEFVFSLKKVRQNLDRTLNNPLLSPEQNELLKNLNETQILQIPIETNQVFTNLSAYLEQFSNLFSQKHSANYAQLTLEFSGGQIYQIEYFDIYNFWNLLSDVGGTLGLYFGLTMVTIYEMITFTFIDREPPEFHTKKEQKLTRKSLYPKIIPTDETVPTVY
uniref:Uncharacterized protein n=1 Tax=Panagrolaimus sp. JU765 TaxID=591449 RepID=A0AC34R326_9BILA